MQVLKFSIFMALWAGLAQAEDCKRLNTVEFLENTPWDQVFDCIKKDQNTFLLRNQYGRNLLMTAVTASLPPFRLNSLINAVPEDQRDEVISAKDKSGRNLGHLAASEAKHLGTFAILSRHGVSFDDKADEAFGGSSPLHFAAKRPDGFLPVAELLAMGGDASKDSSGRTPFDIAKALTPMTAAAPLLMQDDWPAASAFYRKLLITGDAAEDAECNRFLTKAFFENGTISDVIACLKEKNQLVAVDREGNSLLHLAAAFSDDAWILDHILAFADDPITLLGKRNSADRTPLHFAAELGAPAENLAHLLAWGADPDALLREEETLGQNRGITALHIASEKDGEHRLAQILVLLAFGASTTVESVASRSADSKKPTPGGRTALHLAVRVQPPDPRVIAILLEGQYWQESAILSAMRTSRVKVVQDDVGHTALHIAASRQTDRKTLELLESYGFSVDDKDEKGTTPLIYAARHFQDSENFLYLLERSENPCVSSKTGTTVEASLRINTTLMDVGAEDESGKTLSPLAILKQRCQ